MLFKNLTAYGTTYSEYLFVLAFTEIYCSPDFAVTKSGSRGRLGSGKIAPVSLTMCKRWLRSRGGNSIPAISEDQKITRCSFVLLLMLDD